MLSLRGQVLLLFAFGLVGCHRPGPATNGPLTTADSIRRLSWEEASARPQVHLSGTVTVIDSFTQIMFVQDRTGAVWVTMPPEVVGLATGSTIDLSGTATAIGKERAIIYSSIGSIGRGVQPAPRQITRTDLLAEPKNYALGRFRVRIKEMLSTTGREVRFSGVMTGGPVEVSLLNAPEENIGDFVGQEVDVIGVPAPPTQISTAAMPLFLAEEATPPGGRRETAHLPTLTTIREIKSLNANEARRSYPVELRGVVTTSAPASYMLTIQDATGAIYLWFAHPEQYPPEGFQILVQGTSSPGDAVASVAVSKVTVEGPARMPAPADLKDYRINDIRLDNLWVHLDGVIRWVSPSPAGGYRMAIATPQFRTTVVVGFGTPGEASRFVPGAAVSLEGTYSPQSDRFRHWRDFFLYTPSLSGIRIRQSSPSATAEPQATSLRPRNLFGYGTVSSPTVPIRIRGVVTLVGPDGSMYLSDGEGGVQVVPMPGVKAVKPGTLVEVTGFLPIDPARFRLEDATWKALGTSPLPAAPIIQAETALDGSYDSRWVRLEGRLTHAQQAIEHDILVLQSTSALVNVYSTGVPDATWRSLRMGSVLLVRGVVLPVAARSSLAGSRTVSILLGSGRDIQVLQIASWWTPEHLTATLITASALLFALFLLASFLVRRVRSQSRTIEKKLEAEAALKLEAQAASRAKSQFLASMSHEIRTPMNGILGLTDLALQSVGKPEQVNYLQDAAQSARSLMGVLNDVLDLAKIESGKLTLVEESFSLSSVLQPIIDAALLQCKAKGVEFVADVAPDVPDMIIGDALRLRQIVFNLVSNACKFTPTGKVELDASAEGVRPDRFTLVLHVRDTGIGIAPNHISRIFEAFEQVDRSDSRTYGGTGLGLAISLRLARVMGGEIEASSKLDEGSDFCVRLPIQRASPIADQPTGQIPVPTLPGQGASGPLKILAAEDNRINRLLLGRILEKAGFQTVFAENGVETLRLWENGRFDLLLMDVQMPVMDGLEATREIRKREAGTRMRTPIVAVTARAMRGDKDLTVAAGMDGYVSKPYSAEDILTAIHTALHHQNGKKSN